MLGDAVRLLRRQTQLGQVAHHDVLRAQLAEQAAAAARRTAAAQVDAAASDLEILVGAPITAAALADGGDLPMPPQISSLSIDASPMVADALAAAEAAQRDADAARSEWRPRLTLSASGGALGVDPGTTFREDAGGQFLVGVTMPLFDGGARSAGIAAALAAARSASLAADETRRTVASALTRARIEALRARTDAEAWKRAIEPAAENLALMRGRYAGGGDVRLLEVLDALAQSVDTRVNAARAELAYHLAMATQQQLLGESTP
jgi:outer membrane protein TolC